MVQACAALNVDPPGRRRPLMGHPGRVADGAIQARLAELKMRLLILAGTGDKIVDYEAQSVGLHESVPCTKLRPVEDAGHKVHHIAPIAVAEAIERVAGRTKPAMA